MWNSRIDRDSQASRPCIDKSAGARERIPEPRDARCLLLWHVYVVRCRPVGRVDLTSEDRAEEIRTLHDDVRLQTTAALLEDLEGGDDAARAVVIAELRS